MNEVAMPLSCGLELGVTNGPPEWLIPSLSIEANYSRSVAHTRQDGHGVHCLYVVGGGRNRFRSEINLFEFQRRNSRRGARPACFLAMYALIESDADTSIAPVRRF